MVDGNSVIGITGNLYHDKRSNYEYKNDNTVNNYSYTSNTSNNRDMVDIMIDKEIKDIAKKSLDDASSCLMYILVGILILFGVLFLIVYFTI